jgi:hypothetical protein
MDAVASRNLTKAFAGNLNARARRSADGFSAGPGTKALGWAICAYCSFALTRRTQRLIGEPKRDSSISGSPRMTTMVRGIDALRRKSQIIEK